MSPIGEVVHFVNYGFNGKSATCKAAIVTEIPEMGIANLAVIGTNALFFKVTVPYSAGNEPGTYHFREDC